MSAPLACEVQHLRKVFRVGFWGRRVLAVDDVTLQVPAGHVVGLIGPNGAGKTTTLRMLLGFVRPDAGRGTLLGEPLGSLRARARLGYLPELPVYPRFLTGAEVLDFQAGLAGVRDAGWTGRRDGLLERVGLGRAAGDRLHTYSKGMQQRLGIAVALCALPDLLVLDEPMSGLDPLGRHHVREIIRAEHARGCTVLFSSHVLADVEALCDDVAVLARGRVFRAGTLAEVAAGTTTSVEVRLSGGRPGTLGALEKLGPVRTAGPVHVWELQDPGSINAALELALASGCQVLGVLPRQGALEELVLQAHALAPVEGRNSP
ncbi:MAG: ABC transporter ATP-binding protein [Deltaproteobacteria bacterium]|nr:ABC transporter ATP-binding protein [Deltaproteobacteria bacterium]